LAASLKDINLGLLLLGISINTVADDFFPMSRNN